MIEYPLNVVRGKKIKNREVCNDGVCQYKRTSTAAESDVADKGLVRDQGEKFSNLVNRGS